MLKEAPAVVEGETSRSVGGSIFLVSLTDSDRPKTADWRYLAAAREEAHG